MINLEDECTFINQVLAEDDPLATWNVLTRFLPEDIQDEWDKEFMKAIEEEQYEIWRDAND